MAFAPWRPGSREGNIGLDEGGETRTLIRMRLVSYAMHWIKAEMHEYILKIKCMRKWP
jgi:DNA-directed RNA polymerase sigma subunit (sigma70/sigma32)